MEEYGFSFAPDLLSTLPSYFSAIPHSEQPGEIPDQYFEQPAGGNISQCKAI